MGFKHHQNYSPEIFQPNIQSTGPPPLPPRANAASPCPSFNPPSYSEARQTYYSQPLTQSWSAQDPRSSSSQSLVPTPTGQEDERRTLLLIYIHGFLGNETSFQSFPAHVHNLVTVNLANTHVVHTKIYPRYKSRKAIEYATDDFSNWLCPHESAETDIILVGHSMGGILAAEVVLLPPYSRASNEKFRHRILGTINFDTPFLGMHPGVVVSGIGSLFRPAFGPPGPQPPGIQTEKLEARPMPAANSGFPASVHTPVSANLTNVQPSSNSEYSDSNIIGKQTAASPGTVGQTLSSPPLCSGDPNYNPPFGNDMRTPVRTGWDNAIHFVTKHSDGLTRAAKSYVTSHLEFGGCLADYKALKNRYSKIRALEDIRMHQENQSTRVRFVNYYTASTGRPKKVKPSPQSKPSANASELQVSGPIEQELQDMSLSTPEYQSQIETPRISLEHQDRKDCPRTFQILDQAFPMDSNQSSIEDTEMDNMTPEMSLLEANLATDEGFGKKEAENIVDIPAVEPQSPSTDCAPGLPNNGGTVLDYRAIEQELGLLPLPPPPQPPPAHDPTGFADKDARQLAYKEHIRLNKAYLRAFKDRQKAILARENLMEKRTKAARKATEKVSKLTEKERLRVEKEQAMRRPPLTPVEVKSAIIPDSSSIPVDSYDDKGSTGSDVNSRLRDKKFCMLPPKINEQIDPCWVRIFMQGVDEVGAHCGLFFVGEQYERLVADVGDRIKLWVEES